MIRTKVLYIWILIVLLGVSSCDSSIEQIDFVSLKKATWRASDTLRFNFKVSDTIKPKNLFLHIRNSNAYSFSNLYVITKLTYPNKAMIVDTLQYEMADKNGKLLGRGISSTKESKLFYKEKKVFPMSGEYSLTIVQSMRKQGEIEPIDLNGVQEVGFSLEKIK